MVAALGDTAKSKREPAAEPQTARSARQADPGPGLVPWPHQQAATIGISGNAPRHAAQSALAQSEAHTPPFGTTAVLRAAINLAVQNRLIWCAGLARGRPLNK